MNELFSILDDKEKGQLRLLSLLVLAALFALIFFSLGQRRSYRLAVDRLQERDKAAAAAAAKLAEGTALWTRWQEAFQDIKDLKEKRFYHEGDEVRELRLDLQKIFSDSGISARTYRYRYDNLGKKKIGKVDVTFTFVGSYPILKRFLQTLEQFPKLIHLEKIDFLKIAADGNVLELRIILAAYYAQK
jgi:Tfp pilus assembly protein PilO